MREVPDGNKDKIFTIWLSIRSGVDTKGAKSTWENFKTHVYKVLSCLVQYWSWSCFELEVELDTSRGPFQHMLFYDSTQWLIFFLKDAENWLQYCQKLEQRRVLSNHWSLPFPLAGWGALKPVLLPVCWSFSCSPPGRETPHRPWTVCSSTSYLCC